MLEGNEGSTMGNRIQINRMGEGFSSHTQAHSRPRRYRTSRDTDALRQRLIDATVAVVADGSVLRLVESRSQL